MNFLRSGTFWIGFLATLIVTGLVFSWELDLLPYLPLPARPSPTNWDIGITALISVLLSLNTGLFLWRRKNGSCPRGVRRSSGIAGFIAAITLLCPFCLALPVTIASVGVLITIISTFLPILRIIAIVLLVTSTVLLWPKSK